MIVQTLNLVAEEPPLTPDETGTIRVAGTRVTLDVLLNAFKTGSSPEEIVRDFDTLNVSDVYSVIAYYLRNKADVDDYMTRRKEEAEKLRSEMERTHPTSHLRALIEERKSKARQ